MRKNIAFEKPILNFSTICKIGLFVTLLRVSILDSSVVWKCRKGRATLMVTISRERENCSLKAAERFVRIIHNTHDIIHTNLSISANKCARYKERKREVGEGRRKRKNIRLRNEIPREQDRDMITSAKSIVHQPLRFPLQTPAWRHARKQLVAHLLPGLQSNHFCILWEGKPLSLAFLAIASLLSSFNFLPPLLPILFLVIFIVYPETAFQYFF